MKDMVAEPSAAAVGGGTPGLGEREEGSDVCPCLGCSMRTGEVLRTGVSELVVSVAVEAGGLGSETSHGGRLHAKHGWVLGAQQWAAQDAFPPVKMLQVRRTRVKCCVRA